MSKKVSIPVIQPDAVIEIKISGFFHKRLVGAYFNYAKKFEPKKFEELCTAIGNKQLDSLSEEDRVDATTIETLLILISDVEKHFADAKLINDEEVEIPSEDSDEPHPQD